MPEVQDRAPLQRFGEFTLDHADARLIGPDGPVRVGNKAFEVLALLVDHRGRLLTKDALFTSVWDGMAVSESSLTSVVKELRRALGDDTRSPRFIESVYGRGYRFIAPVTDVEDGAPAAAPRNDPQPDPAAPGRPPRVLVSPFNDDAVRGTHPHCASELREETISGLARVREIQLIADDGGGRGDWGERDYQLSATLLPARDAVKVIARATRLKDGRIVWAETMALAGAGATAHGVEKIVRRIVAAALPALDEDISLGLPPDPGDLYDAYLVAKRLSFTATTFEEAISAGDTLTRIIEEQPDFGLAYPPLVRLYNTDFGWTALGATGAEERAQALRLAKRGLAADQGNAHAHSVLGWCYIWHDERDLARRSFERALALTPYNRVRVQEAATAWTYLGDFAGAEELLDRALELDPVPDSDICEDVARLKLATGNYEGVCEMMEQVVRGTVWADLYFGAALTALGNEDGRERMEGWLALVESCWHRAPAPTRAEILAWIRKHHPLPQDCGREFFAPIEQALAG